MHLCSNWVTTRVTQGIWVIRRLRGSGRVPRVASAHLPVLDLPAAFVLGEAAPDAVHLPGLQHEREALALDQAAGTDRLGLVRLLQGLAFGRDRKEQLGIDGPAGGEQPTRCRVSVRERRTGCSDEFRAAPQATRSPWAWDSWT